MKVDNLVMLALDVLTDLFVYSTSQAFTLLAIGEIFIASAILGCNHHLGLK